ncbi:uncharacterized protein LOC130622326 [Hydractinia symbiolongicarpus]|uniref:uncharacterized protein LOC130622326 n=1 Tax=Hydractinia symbiolongicarpus TaxID=13093 RepID=UPI00254C55DC|nr:uncharacterized protein LOC130622326 [Hydractinia symbiolongicarpus]
MKLTFYILYLTFFKLYKSCYIQRENDGDFFTGQTCNTTNYNYPFKTGCKCMEQNSTVLPIADVMKCFSNDELFKEYSREIHPAINTQSNTIRLKCQLKTLKQLKIHDCVNGWLDFHKVNKSILTFNESEITLVNRWRWDSLIVAFVYQCSADDKNNVLIVKFSGTGRKYPLPKDIYKILEKVKAKNEPAEEPSNSKAAIIVGVIFAIVAIISIVILIVCIRKRRQKKEAIGKDEEYEALSVKYKPDVYAEPANKQDGGEYELLQKTKQSNKVEEQAKTENEYLQPEDSFTNTNDDTYEEMNKSDYKTPRKSGESSNKTDIHIPSQKYKTPNNKPNYIPKELPQHLRTEKLLTHQNFHKTTPVKTPVTQTSEKYKVPSNKPLYVDNKSENEHLIEDEVEQDYQIPSNIPTSEDVDYQVPKALEEDHDYQVPNNAPLYSNM